MMELTRISWWTFLIGLGILLILWLIATRTRMGRVIIKKETPWTIPQASALLLIIGITLFILVDPIFHLITFGIFAILYYIFVSKNLLSRNIRNLGPKNDLSSSGLAFSNGSLSKVSLICRGKDFSSSRYERYALDTCLFSFPNISSDEKPEIQLIKKDYQVSVNLSSIKYLSSLLDYIEKAGFEVEHKKDL